MNKTDPHPVHIIVVLGAKLEEDGSPCPSLLERLKICIGVAQSDPDAYILVTGGISSGKETEAQGMARWLQKFGINENRIIVENKAQDTFENGVFSKPLLDKIPGNQMKKVTLVTSKYHIFRSKMIFKIILGNDYTICAVGARSPESGVLLSIKELVAIFRDATRAWFS